MRIAILGAGNVGLALASGWTRAGHQLVLGLRDPASPSARAAAQRLPAAELLPAPEAAACADATVLAVPFAAAAEVAASLGDLGGRPLVDCTNPVGPGLTHGLDGRRAGSRLVQEAAPTARVVKAFSIYGHEVLADPTFAAGTPVMLLAGDDPAALDTTASLARDLGFDPLTAGPLDAALDLEHLTLLWIRLVRAGHHPPGLAWIRATRD